MQNILIDNISLIIFIPFWIFLIIMCGRFFGVYVNRTIIQILTILSSALGSFVCLSALIYFNQAYEWSRPLIKINDFVISAGLYADKLSLIFGLLLFVISFAVQLFSVSYMKNEEKNYRFFALLNLFNFGMSAMIFSPNLYQLYVFWELIGIVSYLFIGFDYKNPVKSDASRKVFLVNRFGDTALLSGIILTTYFMYNNAENLYYTTLSLVDLNSISTMLMGYTSTKEFMIICGLFIVAAMVKSAQFPFHIWLQDAMEAKVPVSALLHSATMVAAGIYLILRLMPFFTLNNLLLDLIILTGIATALLCGIMASVETHPKKVLAYSTSANLGLVFVMAGLVNIKAAIVFLAAHALIKSMLFLTLPKEDKTLSYVQFCIFIFGGLSLAGLIFAGVPAKEFVYSALSGHSVLTGLFLIFVFVTAFYISRLCFIVRECSDIQREGEKTEILSSLILLFTNISFCIILTRGKFVLTLPYLIGLCGVIAAIILNKLNTLKIINKLPHLTEKFIYKCVPAVYGKLADLSACFDEKVFGNYKPIKNISVFCVKAVDFTEQKIMNGSVKLVAGFAKLFSKGDMVLQTKNVQTYNAYAFILVTIIIALVTAGYMLIVMRSGV